METLLDLLQRRAEGADGEQGGFTFLTDGERAEQRLSYAALDLRARAVAARLAEEARPGDRALLLFPPDLELIVAFFGCLYAGVIPVPVFPPDPARLARGMRRLGAVLADAGAGLVLTTSATRALAEAALAAGAEVPPLAWVVTDAIDERAAGAAPLLRADPASIALLQYTSGSTGAPRGVALTHANLLHNSALIHEAFGHSRASRGVIWLPPYHDMGLIGGILQPLYGGFPVVLISPLAFLERPLRWLQAISRHRATTSGGPSFAFELCLRRISPADREGLDLSSWDLAFCGAEPVRADTLDRFAEAFAPCGFRREAFFPCYGLAEATLIVAGGPRGRAPRVERGPGGAPRVGCGRALLDVRIVDPHTGQPRAPGVEGEIWVAGPSVAAGYWGKGALTEEVFGARIADRGEGPFLRTGDLGLLDGGELFVTGRIKDLIILRGKNLYPQDIELSAERSHPALRPGCCAAFPVDEGGEERLVVVGEVDPRKQADPEAVAAAVRRRVTEEHDAEVHAVVLLRPGAVPKTSSGKIQRRLCREELLGGTLEVLHRSAGRGDAPRGRPAELGERVAPRDDLEARIAQIWEQVLRVDGVGARDPLFQLGGDSIAGAQIVARVGQAFGVSVRLEAAFERFTVERLAELVEEALLDRVEAMDDAEARRLLDQDR